MCEFNQQPFQLLIIRPPSKTRRLEELTKSQRQ